MDTKRQFARLKAQYEEEKKAARPAAPGKTTYAPRTKGYTPFEGLGGLFAQQDEE